MAIQTKAGTGKTVETVTHPDATRLNIPTVEYQSVMQKEAEAPRRVTYPRNRDLDPQLMWRGKDEQDWSDLVVNAPPLYIQEKVHPKVLIDDLLRQTKEERKGASGAQTDLFGDFNGIPEGADKTEFYQHDQNWSNRMILGDSLQVMASLAEREGLAGKVQCIYFDPPYGIKFNSNFQWSTTSRDVKDGNTGHITREPEQVKAFRDTWRDGIHSYLTYLRDRLTVARDLLTESGSIFVQIGDENVHRVRALLEEVFGEQNYATEIKIQKTGSSTAKHLQSIFDTVLWYFRDKTRGKFRALKVNCGLGDMTSDITPWLCVDGLSYRKLTKAELSSRLNREGLRIFQPGPINSQHPSETRSGPIVYQGETFCPPPGRQWTYDPGVEMTRIGRANYLLKYGKTLRVRMYASDSDYQNLSSSWTDTQLGGLSAERIYVVQTSEKVVQRCILMCTDPSDLVLDPTCGSGTTAYTSEQWGRRWITIDTSRVALALARARIMGARYPFYLLADSREGQQKEAELTQKAPSTQPVHGNMRHGFVYDRVPQITLKSVSDNAEIDVIWEKWQQTLEPIRAALNSALNQAWEEWGIPGETSSTWPSAAKIAHADWCVARVARQAEIDAAITAKVNSEYLYDRPYEDKKKVRVAGPFTVESLSPHRMVGVDENDEFIDGLADRRLKYDTQQSFPEMILENLKAAGVQQAHKEGRITFSSLQPWPGLLVCAEGRYLEADTNTEKRAAIFIGPEFGTVTRPDLVSAAREAGDADFDVLIACAFNYEAPATEFNKLGRIPVLKARMNADLHMSDELKTTGKGNLFVIFGEPDIDILTEKDGKLRVKVKGIDVFKPQTGEVVKSEPDELACWFIDTDYNEESFFVRHAYFLGANDPYSALKTTLKAEINEEAWASLHSDTSRAFEKPKSGRIAVKVINHLGDEVMKVFRVGGQ
ncbi:MAG: site-specific DNA-methyltransferase [Myxococcota bacterium]